MFSIFPFTSPYFARNRFDPLLQLYTLSNKQIVCVDDLHIHCQCQLYYNYTVSDDISMQRALNYHIVTYKSLNIHSLSLFLSPTFPPPLYFPLPFSLYPHSPSPLSSPHRILTMVQSSLQTVAHQLSLPVSQSFNTKNFPVIIFKLFKKRLILTQK